MSKPEQAQEPTMEEILASIRRIISDDGQEETGAQEQQEDVDAFAAELQEEAAQEEPAEEAPAEAADDDVLELTEELSTEEAEQIIAEASADDDEPDLEFQDPAEGAANMEPGLDEEPEAEPEPAPQAPTAAESLQPQALAQAVASVQSGLLSPQADKSVASAFSSLENFVLSTHSRTLEDLVSDMLKPMLKGWLDVNLPPLVERLVREEIERVTRGRR